MLKFAYSLYFLFKIASIDEIDQQVLSTIRLLKEQVVLVKNIISRDGFSNDIFGNLADALPPLIDCLHHQAKHSPSIAMLFKIGAIIVKDYS